MNTPSPHKVGLVQMSMSPDPETNLQKALALVADASVRGAEVICLPELFRSLYFCQREDPASFDLAEPVPGPTTEALRAAARERQVVLIAPVFERRAAGVYHNSAAVIDADGTLLGLYRKMHIPDDPGFYEKYYFSPGDLGFRAFDTKKGRLAVLICWDQWFPEAARLASLAGASVLFYPTAIGWHPSEKSALGERQLDSWRTVQRGHAIANGVYVAAVNRHGLEKLEGEGIEFWGHSFFAGPQGEVIDEAPADRDTVLIATVDPDAIEQQRRLWPFLRDRRLDAYQGLTERHLGDTDGR